MITKVVYCLARTSLNLNGNCEIGAAAALCEIPDVKCRGVPGQALTA